MRIPTDLESESASQKVTMPVGYLDRHANNAGHISSCERVFGFLHCIQNAGTDIHDKIDKGAAEVQIRTKKGILSIIDVIIVLGQRGIPFRGNWSGDEQAEDGNFALFVDWKTKYNSDLADHLRFARKDAKYTSPQIQNEIISHFEREIRYNIVSSVPQYWSILADETQDCSTCEQVSLCIRYVKENEVYEDFLDFVQIEKMDGRTRLLWSSNDEL